MVIDVCAFIEIRLCYVSIVFEKVDQDELVFDLSFVSFVTNTSAVTVNAFQCNSTYIDGVS